MTLPTGNGKPLLLQRRADAVPGFTDARVRQAHDVETRESFADVDLDLEDAGVDPEEGGGVDTGEHEASSVRGERPRGMRTLEASRDRGANPRDRGRRYRGAAAGIFSLSPALMRFRRSRLLTAINESTVVPCRRAIR